MTAQHNAGKHLSYDSRLVYFLKKCPYQPANGQDHRNLQNQSKEFGISGSFYQP